MLPRIIDFSLKNKFIVLLTTMALVLGGIYAVKNIPLDAIPDLSDTQVIIYTPWEGQAPNIVEDQVTYPITTKMLSVPRAKVVRGYSFYGYSFVYVIFDDGTDPYWARSRVLEYLSSIGGQLPKGVTPTLGPDATGVGWAFMYSINSTNRNLADLRSIQDWYLKYQLTAVPGVSEVASIGGFVKQYQVTVDPTKLRAYNLSLSDVSRAIERSNGEVGGRSIETSEREFILRVKGYITNLDDLKQVAVGVGANGVPILLRDVANVQFGPDERRGIADLNGDGETVGGIVVVRYGANARQVILDVKQKLAQAMKALPPDVKATVVYDRTALIDRAVSTLEEKLIEESLVVAAVCMLFLLHFRSALVAIVILPVAVLISFLIMYEQGISSNIMSLGGIAIAIGVMVDAVVIMIENAHKHIEHDNGKRDRWDVIREAAIEVGPALFYSLLVITVSFLPVFTLQEQEGRLKTFFRRPDLGARKGHQYKQRWKFETWLFSIARHLTIDYRLCRQPESLDALLEPVDTRRPLEVEDTASTSAFEQAFQGEEAERVATALAHLPAAYREVLTLRFHEDLELEEIARIVDSPLLTVKSRLYRGLSMLRDGLKDIYV